MCLFFESIKIYRGKVFNLDYHLKRIHKTLVDHFGESIVKENKSNKMPLLLAEILSKFKLPDKFHKLKVIYSSEIIDIIFEPYIPRVVRSFKLVYDENIEYSYKYLDRLRLERLYELRNGCDDIIIVKKELITDSFVGNLVFFDGKEFHTPKHCLLEGTARMRLLEKKIIIPKNIILNSLNNYKYVFSINAFNDDLVPKRWVSVKNIK